MTSLADIQRRVGVTPDGLWGPKTAAAIDRSLSAREVTGTVLDPALFAAMRSHLGREEGRVPYAYQDNLGFWTIGVGRLIDKRKGGHLSDAEIDMLLANDINRFVMAMQGWPAWEAVRDDPVRATALLSMCFQMGPDGLAGFKNSLKLVAEKRWTEAANNMLQSLWAKQTPARAARVTHMLATGEAA